LDLSGSNRVHQQVIVKTAMKKLWFHKRRDILWPDEWLSAS